MSTEPLVVVSSDTHIGPLVNEQLRDYCPDEHLDDFDAFVAAREEAATGRGVAPFGGHPNSRTAGHHDVDARLRDMNRDGIAAEVIFHGSQNGEPMPFLPQLLGNNATFEFDPELASVGEHIYNRWLADFCSVEPERHVGLAHVPMWDIDAAVDEVEWAAEAGLRGVNFPAPRHGVYLEYNDRAWEPFWSACEACNMALATHVGVASPGRASGPEALALTSIEDGGYFAATRDLVDDLRRRVRAPPQPRVGDHRIARGVVVAHDGRARLHLVVPGGVEHRAARTGPAPAERVLRVRTSSSVQASSHPSKPLGPSERVTHHSFSGVPTTRTSRERGSTPTDEGAEPITRAAQRNTFCEIPPDATRAMLGENAVRVYGLDAEKLAKVAARIDAPTLAELAVPIDSIPAGASPTAFRTFGAWK